MENKELTLWDLCIKFAQWIGKVLVGCWRVFTSAVRVCWRKWWLTVPIFIIAIAVALYLTRPANKWYRADAIALLNGPSTELVQEVLRPITQSLDARRFSLQTQQQLLGLSDEIANKNVDLRTYYVIDCYNDSVADYVDYKQKSVVTDTINVRMRDQLALRFNTNDINTVSAYSDALLNYLNNNPLIVATYESYKADLEREAEFCHTQINRLDSFTYEFYFKQNIMAEQQLEPNRWQMLIGRREAELYHNDILRLIYDTKRVDYRLSLCTAPVVLQSQFAVARKAENGMLKYCLWAVLIAFVVSALLAAAIENIPRFFKWLNSNEH